MYAKRLISSPNLSNTDLVTEAKAALRSMKVQLLQGQLQLSTGTATAYTQFEAARAQLDEGWAQYQSGQEQLDASRTEYETQKPMRSRSSPKASSRSTMRKRRSRTSRTASGMCWTAAAP